MKMNEEYRKKMKELLEQEIGRSASNNEVAMFILGHLMGYNEAMKLALDRIEKAIEMLKE